VWMEFLQDYVLKRQVDFISVNENLDPTTPMGKFTAGMLALSAELFAESTAQNVKESMKRRREAGYPTGRVGYGWCQGYRPESTDEDQKEGDER
jgi:DNA invertase Pin-like site-specific DNA recombinase